MRFLPPSLFLINVRPHCQRQFWGGEGGIITDANLIYKAPVSQMSLRHTHEGIRANIAVRVAMGTYPEIKRYPIGREWFRIVQPMVRCCLDFIGSLVNKV